MEHRWQISTARPAATRARRDAQATRDLDHVTLLLERKRAIAPIRRVDRERLLTKAPQRNARPIGAKLRCSPRPLMSPLGIRGARVTWSPHLTSRDEAGQPTGA